MNLVSIITPSYNQVAYLEQTIQSVFRQDYPRIEYIVIDGGSTDNSFEIIRKYVDRLAYWISERDSGQAEAINKGFKRARGEILAWLNSDDYYLPNTISAAVKCFEENPDVVMIYGDMLAVDGSGQTINVLKYKQYSLEDLLCFQIIGQPSVFFRRRTESRPVGYHVSLFARSSSLDPARAAGTNFACAAGLVGGALSCQGEESRSSHGVRARSVPPAGLGEESARFDGSRCRRGTTRPRLRLSLPGTLSARWWQIGIRIEGVVSGIVPVSTDCPGKVEYFRLRHSQFNWSKQVTRLHPAPPPADVFGR
jgi:hypothetical protein